MTTLGRLGGLLADAAFGLPLRATKYSVEREVGVPMPDGVTLLGDHYRPRSATGPLPVLLVRLPYGRSGAFVHAFAAPYARRGLQLFAQSTRGTFGSGGQFRPFTTEHEDGLATLAWLREQSWCDGRVAMTGGSYFGHTQWAVAPYADPPLAAVCPHITASRITAAFYDHGAPGLENGLRWSAQIGRQESGGLPLPDPRTKPRLQKAMRTLPLQAADTTSIGAPVAFWRDFTGHAGPGDSFWDATDHDDADLGAFPPANMVTGWWDLFVAEQLRDVTRLQAAGVPVRLTVGPWIHGEPGEIRALLRTDVPFLDHHLRGGPAPSGPAVRVLLQQAGTWLESETWPPPGTEVVHHHLHAGGRLSEDPPESGGAPAAFTYDPGDPTPTTGGPLLQKPGKQADQAPVEARADVLVFTGPVLTADLDVVGHVGARVHVRPELAHTDVVVRLCDVDPDGVSRNVVDGIRRLDPATVPADDVTVGEDGVLAVDVSLFPTAYRVRAGHRLRVQVAAGAFPRFARNLGTDEPFASAVVGRTNRVELHHDAEHPSRLELPVLPPSRKG